MSWRHVIAVAVLPACAMTWTACRGETGALPAGGTAAAATQGTASAAREADREWIAALERNDTDALGPLLDTAFEWTDIEGRTRSRADTLQYVSALAADFRAGSEVRHFHYGSLHVITGGRPDAEDTPVAGGDARVRTMRVWALRPEGWRAFAVISTAPAAGATPFAASAAADRALCDNPCATLPFVPANGNQREIAATFMRLKMNEWRPDPDDWAPYVLDDVYYVTATAQLSKAARVEHLRKLKESGAPSLPGDPMVSMRIHEFGDAAAVMTARHAPYRGGKPYYSVRVWAVRDGRWQLANTQQTVIADEPPVQPRT